MVERSYDLAGKTQSLPLRCVYINDVERAGNGREVEINYLLRHSQITGERASSALYTCPFHKSPQSASIESISEVS